MTLTSVMDYITGSVERVLAIVLVITVLVVDILLIRLLYNHLAKKKAITSIQAIPPGIKINAVLLILLGLLGSYSGAFMTLLTSFGVLFGSDMDLLSFLSSTGLLLLGVVCLFAGIGLWRLNYPAWKGLILLLILQILTTFVPNLSYLYVYPLGVLLYRIDYRLFTMIPYLIGIYSSGLLIYIYTQRKLFIESAP
ncbi:MAG: hypothetical protein ACXACR_10570 [Candidatus Hodarchaeales archaeon]